MAEYPNPRPISQPIGSTDLPVGQDNLITLDRLMNAASGTDITNRKGKKLTPVVDIIDGANSAINEAIGASFGVSLGEYPQTYTQYNQYTVYNGQQYGVKTPSQGGPELPYTPVAANPSTDSNLKLYGDASQSFVLETSASALEKSLGVNSRIWPKTANLVVGDTIPSQTETSDGLPITHVIVDGNAYAMSPLASGLVSDLTATGATIGGVDVDLTPASILPSVTFTGYSPFPNAKVGDALKLAHDSVIIAGVLYPLSKSIDGNISSINLTTKPYSLTAGSETIYLLDVRYYQKGKDSVKAYWAAGDNVTDDYACCQACIDNAVDSGTLGALVSFDAGMYKLSRTLRVERFGVMLHGVNNYATILKASDGFVGDAVVKFSRPDGGVLTCALFWHMGVDCNLQPCHGVFYENAYDSTDISYNRVYGVRRDKQALRVSGTGDVPISQTVSGVNNVFLKGEAGTSHTVILANVQECSLELMKAWGGSSTTELGSIEPVLISGCKSITLTQCSFVATSAHGLKVQTNGFRDTRNINLISPLFENCLGGTVKAVAPDYGSNIRITGLRVSDLRIESPSGGGFELDGVDAALIETNFTLVNIIKGDRNTIMAASSDASVTGGTNTVVMRSPDAVTNAAQLKAKAYQIRNDDNEIMASFTKATSVRDTGLNIGYLAAAGTYGVAKVKVGVVDSGGVGFRALIIPN